jgi:hypothetical protein
MRKIINIIKIICVYPLSLVTFPGDADLEYLIWRGTQAAIDIQMFNIKNIINTALFNDNTTNNN